MRVETHNHLIFTGQRAEDGSNIVQMTSARGIELLPMRLDLAHHSAAGFEWGYVGAGPAQLALAICAAVMDNRRALEAHETVEVKLIARVSTDRWTLSTEEVLAAVRRHDKPPSKRWPWAPSPAVT